MTNPGNKTLSAVAATSVAAVGAALVSQHQFGMLPCPWCVLQRAIFLAIALVCVLALAARRGALRLGLSILAALLALSGIAASLWQHFVAAQDAFSCDLSLAEKIISALRLDRLAPAMLAPQTTCADGAAKLLGIPYEFWSLALFAAIAVALVTAVMAPLRRNASRLA